MTCHGTSTVHQCSANGRALSQQWCRFYCHEPVISAIADTGKDCWSTAAIAGLLLPSTLQLQYQQLCCLNRSRQSLQAALSFYTARQLLQCCTETFPRQLDSWEHLQGMRHSECQQWMAVAAKSQFGLKLKPNKEIKSTTLLQTQLCIQLLARPKNLT